MFTMKYFIIFSIFSWISIYVSAQNDLFGGDKPEGATCLFNPCKYYPNYCKNEGFCSFNESTCRYACICKDGYTGSRCNITVRGKSTTQAMFDSFNSVENTTGRTSVGDNALSTGSTAAGTTLRPYGERECIPGFVCIHGYCDKSRGIKCVCDEGWYGPFCKSSDCPLQCGPGYECIISGGSYFCKENDTPLENSTQTIVAVLSTIEDTTMKPIQMTTLSNSADADLPDICQANYTMRPKMERECLPNFVCEYGKCNKTIVGKQIELDCLCDNGAIGTLCDVICCKQCDVNFGTCKVDINGTEYCNCIPGYEGDTCDRKSPDYQLAQQQEEQNWVYWVVGVCLTLLVILALLLVALPYYMWKNRVTLIMKIVHYFQPYEDEDDRTWDAFISYKSHEIDETFVINTLFPKLEKEMGFSLCMHFRDFLPGDTIANNIINAVDNSRRTILVLSPRYVQSEFTRFEYQVAQTEMLKRKHRIIPILLEDISGEQDTMDPNLKQIIKSVTYLEYPGADDEKKINSFWKRLELSLPKKRSKDTTNKSEGSPSVVITKQESNEDVTESSKYRTIEAEKDTSKDSTEMTISEIEWKSVKPEEVNVIVKDEKGSNGDLHYNIEKYMNMMENSNV